MKKLLTILLLFPLMVKASIFYTSPIGTGTGTLASPFALQTALSQPVSIHAGDTIYLLAGTYIGNFTSNLTGTISSPILVKPNPGDRVIIDGTRAAQTIKYIAVLTINGAYTNYQGLEITNSDSSRVIATAETYRGIGVEVYGIAVKVINCIIYDTGGGFGAWTPATNSEYHGNVIFNNGWKGSDRQHGHGIYTQNNTGIKVFSDNIILNNFENGWDIYGSQNAQLNNFYISGNVCFNDRWLMGGIAPINNLELDSNFAYNDRPEFGYVSQANSGLTLKNNYFATGFYLYYWTNVSGNYNTLYRGTMASPAFDMYFPGAVDLTSYHFDNNTYYVMTADSTIVNQYATATWKNTATNATGFYFVPAWKSQGQDVNGKFKFLPLKNDVFVRKNRYDPNRSEIIIYNLQHLNTVSVPVAGILTAGDLYELHNVQNYFGDVINGTFTGTDSLTVPMTGHTVALPLGFPTVQGANTFPDFGTFVLIRKPAPVIINQCHNIDSLISLVTVMQGQIITLQNSINTIGASGTATATALTAALVRITALEAALTALQNKVAGLKAITTIQ